MWHVFISCYSNWYIGTCDLSCFSINNSCWRPQRKATHLQADQSSAQILQLRRGETSFSTVEQIVAVIWSYEDKQIFLPLFPWLIFSDVQWLLGEDQLVSGCSSEEKTQSAQVTVDLFRLYVLPWLEENQHNLSSLTFDTGPVNFWLLEAHFSRQLPVWVHEAHRKWDVRAFMNWKFCYFWLSVTRVVGDVVDFTCKFSQ